MNLVRISFLWLSRIASVLRVVAYSYCDVLIFPPSSVVSSSGDILSLQPVLSQAKPTERTSRGELPSGRLRAALGIWPCAVARFGSVYPQSDMLNLPGKMEVDG